MDVHWTPPKGLYKGIFTEKHVFTKSLFFLLGLLNSLLIRVKPRSKDTPRWYASMGLSLVSLDLDGFWNKPFEVCPRRPFFLFLALKLMFLSSGTSKIGSGRSYLYIGRWSRGRLTHQKAGICHFCDLFGGSPYNYPRRSVKGREGGVQKKTFFRLGSFCGHHTYCKYRGAPFKRVSFKRDV